MAMLRNNVQKEAWLCLRFTHLALNSAGFVLQSEQAIAISHQQKIWQCNNSATHITIQPGISVNHALMLCPGLYLQERNQQQEKQTLHKLSHWAYRFTAMVSIHNDHTLLLEVGKSIKLFNNLDNLINLIQDDLNTFQIEASLGVAYTPKAAYALSFIGHHDLSSSLAALQKTHLIHLDVDQKIIAKLHNCGFKSLKQISNIENRELGARFGAVFLDYLNRLWGSVPDPQLGTTPPETFHANVDFAEPISNLLWIQQQIESLLSELENFITTRQLICRSFTWRFYKHNNKLLKTISIHLSANQNTLKTFLELTELKLARITLKWEFSNIDLSSHQLVPIELFNDDLFDPQPDQDQFNLLIDKLVNRLGHSALYRVNPAAEQLPEFANKQLQVEQERSVPDTTQKHQPTSHANLKDEPLWLLQTPKSLAQQKRQPFYKGPLSIIHGPNRISSHWWEKQQSRDYFIARQRNGRLLWIFYDRGNRHWYLHGLFA